MSNPPIAISKILFAARTLLAETTDTVLKDLSLLEIEGDTWQAIVTDLQTAGTQPDASPHAHPNTPTLQEQAAASRALASIFTQSDAHKALNFRLLLVALIHCQIALVENHNHPNPSS